MRKKAGKAAKSAKGCSVRVHMMLCEGHLPNARFVEPLVAADALVHRVRVVAVRLVTDAVPAARWSTSATQTAERKGGVK